MMKKEEKKNNETRLLFVLFELLTCANVALLLGGSVQLNCTCTKLLISPIFHIYLYYYSLFIYMYLDMNILYI